MSAWGTQSQSLGAHDRRGKTHRLPPCPALTGRAASLRDGRSLFFFFSPSAPSFWAGTAARPSRDAWRGHVGWCAGRVFWAFWTCVVCLALLIGAPGSCGMGIEKENLSDGGGFA